MKQSSAPSVITTPFSDSGSKNTIPQTSTTGATDGLATWSTGFPDSTMIPISAGGIPPHGKDFNGILNAISSAVRWLQSGGLYQFNQNTAAAIGGYSKGALVLGQDGLTIYKSLSDSNTNNPDSELGSAFWLNIATLPDTYISGTTGKTSGDLTGIAMHWDTSDGYPVFGYQASSGIVYEGLATRDFVSSGSLSNGYWKKIGSVLTQYFYVDISTGVTVNFPITFDDGSYPIVDVTWRDSAGRTTVANISGDPTSSSVVIMAREVTSSGWGDSSGRAWITATGSHSGSIS